MNPMDIPTEALPDDRIRAEIGKLMAETVKLAAEQRKLNAEATKMARESAWYPVVLMTAALGAGAALAKLLAYSASP